MTASRKRSNTRAAAPEVIRLLHELTGREHVVLTGRGAAGIWAALKAMGFRDRRILLPANTCYIVLWAVLRSGNHPLLIDIDPRTGNITSEALQSVSEAAAIIPAHMYGLPAPMEAITAWARQQGVTVIEDAALALGGEVQGRPAGAWGEALIFSFGQGKIADHEVGGAFLTDDTALAKEVKKFMLSTPEWDDRLLALTNQWHGLYWPLHQYESHNPRLLSLYSALFQIYGDLTAYRLSTSDWNGLPEMLKALPQNHAHRAHLAEYYDVLIEKINREKRDFDDAPLLRTLPRPAGATLWRYPLLVNPRWRDDLLAHLWEQGVHDATRWYPALRHMTVALAPDTVQPSTPGADQLADSIINLRLDPAVDLASVEHVMALISAFFT